MKTVITYGTYDLLHEGHIRLLQRAKKLGDYLIVGVTSDDFDKTRGKINVQQSLMERVEALRKTNIADKIIIEEYVGQKIDDIIRYNVDIFTVGSDWEGKFDYLNEFCEVVYLSRTKGISSSQLRTEKHSIKLGIFGNGKSNVIKKYITESGFVNGLEISGAYSIDSKLNDYFDKNDINVFSDCEELLENSDAIYVCTDPKDHYEDVKFALEHDRHVICESPICLSSDQADELFEIAESKGLVLVDAIKTAFSMAYNRLVLLVKSGRIGDVISIDCTCSSIPKEITDFESGWNSINTWGPIGMLPILHLFGVDYSNCEIVSLSSEKSSTFDLFSNIRFRYENGVGNVKLGLGVKSEGELIISGTKGYVYVPAPWWKTDYFEVRFEDQSENKRFFYQLEGEGIRYELVAFVKMIENNTKNHYIDSEISKAIVKVLNQFYLGDKFSISKQ